MHVKVDDTVQIIAGREKGKVGEVTRLYKHNSTVIVKDMNLKSKHKKGTEDEPGEIVMVSNISIETSFGASSCALAYIHARTWFQMLKCYLLMRLGISFDQIEGPIHSSNVNYHTVVTIFATHDMLVFLPARMALVHFGHFHES